MHHLGFSHQGTAMGLVVVPDVHVCRHREVRLQVIVANQAAGAGGVCECREQTAVHSPLEEPSDVIVQRHAQYYTTWFVADDAEVKSFVNRRPVEIRIA
jgi:hypothetical protein